MDNSHDIDTLKAEWAALFERVWASGERAGKGKAIATLFASARAQLDGDPVSSLATAARPESVKSQRAKPTEAGRRHFNGKRAPSGSIQREVRAIIAGSLAPLSVRQVIDETERRTGARLKDTSVRMALTTMARNGEVRLNDIGEWSLTPSAVVEPSKMPSDDGHSAMREAA